ncbi:oxidoreductase [Pedobacter lusitanus]|uniref:Oxidoreductase n=1 Tax=Pedobacter lusitanus TaxID=1503925 RepID=A0A0D0GD63_9SPHI|nr:SDR family NAD(P)-dependent oxidoreductase [Pedobacter lusitanus]KIO75262.1 oxidoreductase [Pedobacter lusitanus]
MNNQLNLPLAGKVALVTGASSGIGQGTARALAQSGAIIVIAARRIEKLAVFEKELVAQGSTVLSIELDVTLPANCEEAINSVIEKFGRLDILVNSAGLMLLGPVQDGNLKEWAEQINTNLLGLMYMTRFALPHLIETRGAVVQISSTASRAANLNGGIYSGTKWGVNGFSEGLRKEVSSKGVKVIVIEPGVAQTELRQHITDEAAKKSIDTAAAKMRQLQPADIAETIVFAVTRPDHVLISELLIRPLDQDF